MPFHTCRHRQLSLNKVGEMVLNGDVDTQSLQVTYGYSLQKSPVFALIINLPG